MAGVDYKTKYLDMRSKFKDSCESYYKMGYEEGMKEAQMQAQAEAQQQQQEEQMMQQGIDPETGQPIEPQIDPETGQPIDPAMQGQEMSPEEMGEEAGTELDQQIGELESLVSKGEKPKVTDIRKIVREIADLRKSHKNALKSNHKEVTVSEQKNLVNGILKKWETEANTKSVTDNLEEIILKEGIKLEE